GAEGGGRGDRPAAVVSRWPGATGAGRTACRPPRSRSPRPAIASRGRRPCAPSRRRTSAVALTDTDRRPCRCQGPAKELHPIDLSRESDLARLVQRIDAEELTSATPSST